MLYIEGSLNPCFNGICSTSNNITNNPPHPSSLNPCFNGICSTRTAWLGASTRCAYCLNPCFNGICSTSVLYSGGKHLREPVSILVLMEYALLEVSRNSIDNQHLSKHVRQDIMQMPVKNGSFFRGAKLQKMYQKTKELIKYFLNVRKSKYYAYV